MLKQQKLHFSKLHQLEASGVQSQTCQRVLRPGSVGTVTRAMRPTRRRQESYLQGCALLLQALSFSHLQQFPPEGWEGSARTFKTDGRRFLTSARLPGTCASIPAGFLPRG